MKRNIKKAAVLAIALIIIAAAFAAGMYFYKKYRIDPVGKKIINEIDNNAVNNVCTINIKELTDFEWDTLVVADKDFKVYTGTECDRKMSEIIGSDYHFEDGYRSRLIFVKNHRVVYEESYYASVEKPSKMNISIKDKNNGYCVLSAENSKAQGYVTDDGTSQYGLIFNSVEDVSTDKEEKSSLTHFNNQDIKNFIYRKNFYKVNDWIYYWSDSELRKCKPDLTENTLLEQDVYNFYIQNSNLYYIKNPQNNSQEIYWVDLNNVNLHGEKISEFKDSHNWIVYKNSIIYTKDITNELMIYNIDQNTEKECVCDNVAYFSVLDHYIYYSIYDDDAVYIYDIDSGKSELFLEFEKQDNFAPKTYYRDRMIVIQTDVNKFIYTDVDNKILKKVSFDISEYERGWAAFHFADSENLYFSVAEHYDAANPLTTPRSIYKVQIGTDQIGLVKEIIGENIGFLTDEYLYSFNEDKSLKREKL